MLNWWGGLSYVLIYWPLITDFACYKTLQCHPTCQSVCVPVHPLKQSYTILVHRVAGCSALNTGTYISFVPFNIATGRSLVVSFVGSIKPDVQRFLYLHLWSSSSWPFPYCMFKLSAGEKENLLLTACKYFFFDKIEDSTCIVSHQDRGFVSVVVPSSAKIVYFDHNYWTCIEQKSNYCCNVQSPECLAVWI